MLKRSMALLLALLLFAVPLALAEQTDSPETREEIITLEGMEEAITTTRFVSNRGYALWYDPLIIQPVEESEGVGMDDFEGAYAHDGLYIMSIHYAEMLDYTFEQALIDTQQTMQENHADSGLLAEGDLFAYPYQGFCSSDNDITDIIYVVQADPGMFFIHCVYPSEAEEGFGSRISQMLGSFEILPRPEA